MSTTTPFPATERQMAFIGRLLTEKATDNGRSFHEVLSEQLAESGGIEGYLRLVQANGKLAASTMIDTLLARPNVTKAARPSGNGDAAPAPKVPVGRYATASRTGNNDLDFWKIETGKPGSRWEGYTFVKRIIGGHDDVDVRGAEAKAALEAIVTAGIEESGLLYAQESENCRRCGRHLTVAASRHQGYGPECIKKVEGI